MKQLFLLTLMAALAGRMPIGAQGIEPLGTADDPITLTIDEAVEIAVLGNYAVRGNRLDVLNADAQVREAWGNVMPNVNANSSYTRNILSANPFAGSDAGSFFSSFGFIDWLAFNERARTDDSPSTDPITFVEYQRRQQEGMEEAGISMSGSGDNPFAVPNQFINGVSVEQTLYSGTAFAAIQGAQALKDINQRALDRQEQLVVHNVRQAFYQALLAQERANVAVQSVSRTRTTLQEVSRRVTQGVAPKFQRLSAEVQLGNLETQLLQLQNQTATVLDNFKMILGIPVQQPVTLRGELDAPAPEYLNVAVDNAVETALIHRPDLEQAALAIKLNSINTKMTRAQYFPTLTGFANFNYIGNVPDNRTRTISDPTDPFKFSQETNGFFSDSYWDPSINAGIRLSWNLFNGFQTTARVQQNQIAVERAQLQYEQLVQSVRLEVEQALRNLKTARQQIISQEQNVARAELNYQFAETRLAEGVASQLEEREASEQLDQSRINYLQAVYDYVVAQSAFETSIGMPLAGSEALQFTRND